MRRLDAGEGTTGREYDNLDSVFSTELGDEQGANTVKLGGIITAAIHEADGDPKSLAEAQSRPDWPQWKEAMNRELTTLIKASTWKPVPHLPGKNVIGSKWVFCIKCKADRSVKKYKA